MLGYVLAFEMIGAFALIMPLLYWDHGHTILTNPAGYAMPTQLPIGSSPHGRSGRFTRVTPRP